MDGRREQGLYRACVSRVRKAVARYVTRKRTTSVAPFVEEPRGPSQGLLSGKTQTGRERERERERGNRIDVAVGR